MSNYVVTTWLNRKRLYELITWDVVFRPLEASTCLLADVPAEALVDFVLDNDELPNSRVVCARALLGRVPREHTAALLALGRSGSIPGQLRSAVLITVLSMPGLPDSDDLLAWLSGQRIEGGLSPDTLDPAIQLGRAISGDRDAVRALTASAADPWWTRRTHAEQALEALVILKGYPAVLSAFGVDSAQALAVHGSSPAERLLGLRLQWRVGGDITPCLGDESTMVARKAFDLLLETDGDGEETGVLQAMVHDGRPGAVWAAVLLHERGSDDVDSLGSELGSPRVDVPYVPLDIREAIVRQYAPGLRDTDPRWLLEAARLPPPSTPADRNRIEEDRLQLAVRALAAAGLEPQEPQSAGDYYGQGEGTYDVISTTDSMVLLSRLGPYFVLNRGNPATRPPGYGSQAESTMLAAGFRYIDRHLGRIEFAGLHVYHFGERGPLNVSHLLFFWQD